MGYTHIDRIDYTVDSTGDSYSLSAVHLMCTQQQPSLYIYNSISSMPLVFSSLLTFTENFRC